MHEVTHDAPDVVLTACDLATGRAVRFGSLASACSRLGDILDPVPVSLAVAASAAYPALLPALEQRFRIRDRHGDESDRVLLLTDGGVFDNLGLSVFGANRDHSYTRHVYDVDYVIACDAGPGPTEVSAHVWPTRLSRVVNIMHGRAQHGERGRFFAERKGREFVYAFLGMRDDRLPSTLPELVPRESVINYPTDFRAMSPQNLELISTRGQQLVGSLLSWA